MDQDNQPSLIRAQLVPIGGVNGTTPTARRCSQRSPALQGLLHHVCCVDRNAAAFGLAGSVAASDAPSQFVESCADTLPGRAVVGDLVVAATKVLYEGVTGCHDAH